MPRSTAPQHPAAWQQDATHRSGLNASGSFHSCGERCRFHTLMKMSDPLVTCEDDGERQVLQYSAWLLERQGCDVQAVL